MYMVCMCMPACVIGYILKGLLTCLKMTGSNCIYSSTQFGYSAQNGWDPMTIGGGCLGNRGGGGGGGGGHFCMDM